LSPRDMISGAEPEEIIKQKEKGRLKDERIK
jgi:hypothetical protein